MEYGLIGAKLGHSYSKLIHKQLADYEYHLRELPETDDLHAFLKQRDFCGINVTIPYKEAVIPYCDTLDDAARAIGSVNTIVRRNGRLEGHNTDFAGFAYLLRKNGIVLRSKIVMILGTGGTQKTAAAVAKAEGAAQILTVSRTPRAGILSYAAAKKRTDVQVIINTTPVGMFPQNERSLLAPEDFPRLYAAVDVIYNPLQTDFLLRAKACGARTANGLSMLVAQAKYAAEYFTGKPIDDAKIDRIEADIRKEVANLVLIGMPSAGKTTIGKYCAQKMNRPFLDLDEQLERECGMTIPEIFAREGEQGFRAREKQLIRTHLKGRAAVIAAGGGAVLDDENVRCMRQNSVVIWLTRPLHQLEIGAGRPLSVSYEALREMQRQRMPLYQAASDACVENNSTPHSAAQAVMEAFHEVLDCEWTES